jgi:hypothetical protein
MIIDYAEDPYTKLVKEGTDGSINRFSSASNTNQDLFFWQIMTANGSVIVQLLRSSLMWQEWWYRIS